jgi:putative tryptophan/tyrosine transport system substrate-binding protein
MASYIARRTFLATLGGAAAWPLAARGQREVAVPIVGFLGSQTPSTMAHGVVGLRDGLKESGYVEGRNVTIEYRWADNQYDRLPVLAAELLSRQVAVIVASGGNVSALAAKAATPIIPIVFTAVADPVKGGLVASLNRPGGNVTGIAALTLELDAKRLELLLELAPTAGAIGALVDSSRVEADSHMRDLQAAAQTIGRQLVIVSTGSERDFDTSFEALVRQRVAALLIAASPLFTSRRDQLVALAARHAIPTIFQFREFTTAGGLISYGASLVDAYRQAGVYVGRILRGEKPSDLPVMRPTKFELVINLKTAKTLGLEVPPTLLARADEVIE